VEAMYKAEDNINTCLKVTDCEPISFGLQRVEIWDHMTVK